MTGNADMLQRFLDAVRATDVEELRWVEGNRRVAFRRAQVHPRPPSLPAAPDASNTSAAPLNAPAPERRFPIKSPMVGTFHRAPSQEHPPLAAKGTLVTPGQKVAVIEAMKVMKDVVSPIGGRIEEILVEHGTPVEYGQELFLVEPHV